MSLPEISVFLVDDHNLFRDGLKLLIDEAPDIRVVGTASSATEALRKADGLEIQVLMTDLSLPGKDGFWLVQELRKRFPRLSIHVLSMHSDPICVIKALEMGASGYLTKTADKSEILNAIRAAAKGESYLQPVVCSHVVDALKNSSSAGQHLSERELQVLELLCMGYSNPNIAKKLYLYLSTVKATLRALFKNLEVSSRTEAIVVATKLGLIKAPQEH